MIGFLRYVAIAAVFAALFATEASAGVAEYANDLRIDHGWVNARSDWEDRARAVYRDHFAELDDLYFLRGRRTLKSLRMWTQGRAHGPQIESRNPETHVEGAPARSRPDTD